MNIEQIRIKTAYNPNARPSQKDAARDWLRSLSSGYPIALTLTLNQVITELRNTGTVKRTITREDCVRIAKRFTQKLNRQVFGKSAERNQKSLKYLIVIEGERSRKNLHLHFAIGGLPKHVKLNQIEDLVRKAKTFVENVGEEHKVEIAGDSGWMEYITKELGRNDTDNVLWELA